MTLTMQTNSDGTVLVKYDAAIDEKAGTDFDVTEVDVSEYRVNAETLSRLYNDAQCRGGTEYAQRFLAMKQKFIKQQELIAEERAKPKVSHAPAITARATIPVNAD